jgi:hypothetical protein
MWLRDELNLNTPEVVSTWTPIEVNAPIGV